jgi:hypothetical protein
MLKGYISRWERREAPESRIIDYWFTSNPDSAAHWETKEHAEADCQSFFNPGISIPSALGGTHTCRDFKAEERKPNEFVVFCEAPFIPQT